MTCTAVLVWLVRMCCAVDEADLLFVCFSLYRESDYGLVTRDFEAYFDELLLAAVQATPATSVPPKNPTTGAEGSVSNDAAATTGSSKEQQLPKPSTAPLQLGTTKDAAADATTTTPKAPAATTETSKRSATTRKKG